MKKTEEPFKLKVDRVVADLVMEAVKVGGGSAGLLKTRYDVFPIGRTRKQAWLHVQDSPVSLAAMACVLDCYRGRKGPQGPPADVREALNVAEIAVCARIQERGDLVPEPTLRDVWAEWLKDVCVRHDEAKHASMGGLPGVHYCTSCMLDTKGTEKRRAAAEQATKDVRGKCCHTRAAATKELVDAEEQVKQAEEKRPRYVKADVPEGLYRALLGFLKGLEVPPLYPNFDGGGKHPWMVRCRNDPMNLMKAMGWLREIGGPMGPEQQVPRILLASQLELAMVRWWPAPDEIPAKVELPDTGKTYVLMPGETMKVLVKGGKMTATVKAASRLKSRLDELVVEPNEFKAITALATEGAEYVETGDVANIEATVNDIEAQAKALRIRFKFEDPGPKRVAEVMAQEPDEGVPSNVGHCPHDGTKLEFIGSAGIVDQDGRWEAETDRYRCHGNPPHMIFSTDADVIQSAEIEAAAEDVVLPGTTPLSARAWTDDRVMDVSFDAGLWFRQASDEDVAKLAMVGWSREYPADEVAHFMAVKNEELADMFKYIEILTKAGKGIGFECEVNEEDAKKWLKAHGRTAVWSTEK